MIELFEPKIDKVYFINKYTLLHIRKGTGSIQVDFNTYFNWEDKAIFLNKGQYIKFLSDDFLVRRIEFEEEIIFKKKDVRVLFKHLISLGYIDFDDCEDCKKFLNNNVFNKDLNEIIDISSRQWYWQNPFHASKEEYQIIFDIKDIIDDQYTKHLSNNDIISLINTNSYNAQKLIKNKVGLSIKNLNTKKLIEESKKSIAYSEKNIQEIAFEMGYSDPAYFNRVFKKMTGVSPMEFRGDFNFVGRNILIQDIISLIKEYHTTEKNINFYADKLHMNVKTLSSKVKKRLNLSLSDLIKYEVIISAQNMLCQGLKINEVASELGFDEPNNFSSFFKLKTGYTPSDYKIKKCNN